HVAMLAAALLGLRFSFTAHAKDIYHQEVDPDVLRLKMRGADLVVTVTEYNRRTLLARGAGIPDLETKLVCLHNGVDLSLFRPPSGGDRPRARILGVGRLVEKKGFPTLVRACAILRGRGARFTCELIGSGPEESTLRVQIQALGLHDVIVLRGGLPLEEAARATRSASLLVLPCVVAS